MKTKLLCSLLILLFFSCKPKHVSPVKVKKVAVHTFTGKGEHDEVTNWFFIKNVSDRGYSGFYLESTSKVEDFKQMHFLYSQLRPLKFEAQSTFEEKVQFLDPDDLPDSILKHLSDLESISVNQ